MAHSWRFGQPLVAALGPSVGYCACQSAASDQKATRHAPTTCLAARLSRCDTACSQKAAVLNPARHSSSLFSFGVIADIQYADIEDRGHPESRRHYRHTLEVVKSATQWWRDNGKLDFLLHAGDMIDQLADSDGAEPIVALHAVASCMPKDVETLALIGNHELYNFTRNELRLGLDTPFIFAGPNGAFNFRYEPPAVQKAKWRFLVIDPFEVSVISGGRGADLDPDARLMLRMHNPNFESLFTKHPDAKTLHDLDQCDWYAGIVDRGANLSARWTPLNGAMSQNQLGWLRNELETANREGVHVCILTHIPLHPNAHPDNLAWNYDEIMSVLQDHRLGKCVQMVISGHAHCGGFCTDEHGIHHLTFETPMYTEPGMADKGAFCRVDVLEKEVRIIGYTPKLSAFQEEDARGHVLENPGLCERVLPLRE
jgi:manganese-dependent ADP-ribose/CDP-alcohol diphosphatase